MELAKSSGQKQSPGKLAAVKKSFNVKYNSMGSIRQIKEDAAAFLEELEELCTKHNVYVNTSKTFVGKKQITIATTIKTRHLKFGKLLGVFESKIKTTKPEVEDLEEDEQD
jgi:uncharacterized FlgJ-related protein